MNTVITQQDSQINNLKGQIAVVIDGVQHLVKEGEIIPKGAELIIGNNASANLAQADGSNVAIGATEQQGQAAATDAEIQQLQDLIAAGQDPTANLPETAAGNPISGGGDSGYVAVSRDGSEVLASSGYDTGTFSVAGTTTTQDPLTTYLASSAVDDVNTIEEDTVATGNVLTNDTISGGSLTVTDYVVEGNSYAAGNTAALENGTLTLNSDGSYTFTPDANWNGTVPVITYTTSAGDTATLTITVTPVNDAPELAPDVGSVDESATLTVSAINGVLSNDTDVDGNSLTVTGIMPGTTGTMTAITSGSATTLTNEYGTLTINADGSYNFAATGEASKALADGENAETVFTYTATDGTDALTSTLTITISGVDDTISLMGLDGVEQAVSETNLADGSSPDSALLTQDGTFSFSTTGTVDTLTIDGATLTLDQLQNLGSDPVTITTEHGTLVLTNYTGDKTGGEVSYSYTLDTSVNNNTVPGADDNGYTESFAVTVTATDGNSQSDSLDIYIADDVPTAVSDTDTVTAGSFDPINGNVITGVGTTNNGADTVGADNATVTAIAHGTNTSYTTNQDGSLSIAGTYGTLTIAADGSYNYARAEGSAGGVEDVFTYTLTDGDGDSKPATLTISIGDDTPTVDIPQAGGDSTTVYEAGLPARNGEPAGSHAGDGSNTTTGTITFTAHDGLQGITLGGYTVNAGATPQYLGDGLSASYAFDANTGTGTISYSYTLPDNTSGDDTTADFDVVVTDTDGDKTSGTTLSISIVDDVPTAVNDTDSIAAAGNSATGNVITGVGTTNNGADTVGADNASVTAITSTSGNAATTNANGDFVIVGLYGTLTIDAEGNYSYARAEGSQGGVSDVFTYTLTDSDGDDKPATLTISIGD
ncbi:retention module-containing protein, partial [Shewanella sp. A32]|uniref:retention module-containing protein n=1 Tax=Shewanella sp. A32 TaxID=3031327 RepID=UPI0023B983D9